MTGCLNHLLIKTNVSHSKAEVLTQGISSLHGLNLGFLYAFFSTMESKAHKFQAFLFPDLLFFCSLEAFLM